MIQTIIETLKENEMAILWSLTIFNFMLGFACAKEIEKINKRE